MTSLRLKKFRVDLIRSLSWKERKEIRWLSPGMEAQRAHVMGVLGQRHRLYDRMIECGSDDDWGKMKLCGVPLCPRCFMRRRGRETGQALKKSFVDIPNEQLAFLTLLLPVQTDLGKVEASQRKAKNSLGNIIDYQRRRDARWNDVQFTGWWEMERITASDRDKQGRNTLIALEALGFPIVAARADTTVWRPHLHAIVALGNVTREEFAQALRSKGYDKPYQVDLQPFHTNRPVHANIKSVVRYSLKFRIEHDSPTAGGLAYDKAADQRAGRNWWSDKDIRAYADWLMRGRSGFESLRIVKGPKKSPLVSSVSGSDPVTDLRGINVHDISVHDTNWLTTETQPNDRGAEVGSCDVAHTFPVACSDLDSHPANEGAESVLTTDHSMMPGAQNNALGFQRLRTPEFAQPRQYASAPLYPEVARVSWSGIHGDNGRHLGPPG